MDHRNNEVCSLCQNPLTAFGSKVAKDGVICRDCAKKASPFLTDEDIKRRSIARMKNHLEYRERNLKKLANFRPSKEVDGKYRLCVEEKRNRFLFSKRNNWEAENPDIFYFRQIKDIRIEEVLYPESTDDYDVYLVIKLGSSQIREIRIRTNEFAAYKKDTPEYAKALATAKEFREVLSAYMSKEEN